MNAATRVRWRVRLETVLWRHGSLGLAALVVLLAAAWLMAWLHQENRLTLAQTRHALTQELHSAPTAQTPVPQTEEAAMLEALRAALASSPVPHQVVRQIASLSRQHGIAWSQGEYRAQWHADTQATQWLVTQPALLTYPQLRQLIHAVLRAHPNVSLDQVTVQRGDTTQAQVEVRLRWSIWTLGTAAPR